MIMKPGSVMAVVIAGLFVAGCAVRLGGPSPVDQDAVALRVPADATADQIAQLLKQRGVDYAILSGQRDSAWYADVATRAALTSTRPGRAGATTFAFLGTKAIGDTTLSLKVPGGGELLVHDALYTIDKNRRLDLMAVRIEAAANLRESIRTLLAYIATDVLPNAAVLLAIEPAIPALGDSISILTRAAFADAWECTRDGRTNSTVTDLPIRLFYGPAVRMTCESAERIDIGGGAIIGQFVLPR
jgi:hypothetical protein